MSARVVEIPTLYSEQDVHREWPGLFGKRELSDARRGGLIGYYRTQAGFRFSAQHIADYLASKEHQPCQMTVSNIEATGSGESPADRPSTPTGTNEDVERFAERVLAQGIGRRAKPS